MAKIEAKKSTVVAKANVETKDLLLADRSGAQYDAKATPPVVEVKKAEPVAPAPAPEKPKSKVQIAVRILTSGDAKLVVTGRQIAGAAPSTVVTMIEGKVKSRGMRAAHATWADALLAIEALVESAKSKGWTLAEPKPRATKAHKLQNAFETIPQPPKA